MSNNYCFRCKKNTEDTTHISEHLGLKSNQRMCTVECEVCGIVKFTGRLTALKEIGAENE